MYLVPMFRRHNSHNSSVIGSFFDWPESPFRWKTLDRLDPFKSYKKLDNFCEDNFCEEQVIKPLQPIKPGSKQVNFDDLVIRVNPAKFPAIYIEPRRNFIPAGRRALTRTPRGERSRSLESVILNNAVVKENIGIPRGNLSIT